MGEAWSLFVGLQIATNLRICKLVTETDCQELFNLMTNAIYDQHPLFVIISNCRLLITSMFEGFQLRKINRKQNSCADILAKEAREDARPTRTYAIPPRFAQMEYLKDLRNI